MRIEDFIKGREFAMGDGRYLCTDVGTRVAVAIRLDRVLVVTKDAQGTTNATLDYEPAAQAGWFNGPPYAVAEIVIDEDDMAACEPV